MRLHAAYLVRREPDSGDQLMLDLSGGEETLADRLGEMASRAASVAALEEVMLPKLRETADGGALLQRSSCRCARCLPKWNNEGFLADA